MHALETKQASSGEQYRSRVRRRDPRDATRAAAGDATRAICCMMDTNDGRGRVRATRTSQIGKNCPREKLFLGTVLRE